jgi:hypothetical protein
LDGEAHSFRVVLPHLTQKHFSFLTLAIFFILHCHGNNKDNKTKTTRITYEDGDSSHVYNCLLRVKTPSLPTTVHYDVGPNKFFSGAHLTINGDDGVGRVLNNKW